MKFDFCVYSSFHFSSLQCYLFFLLILLSFVVFCYNFVFYFEFFPLFFEFRIRSKSLVFYQFLFEFFPNFLPHRLFRSLFHTHTPWLLHLFASHLFLSWCFRVLHKPSFVAIFPSHFSVSMSFPLQCWLPFLLSVFKLG